MKNRIKTKRPKAGRPPKPDKDQWGQVTCVLRHETIARLREGSGSRFFGEFLEEHLTRYPPPDRLQYQSIHREQGRREETYKETKTPGEIAAEKEVRAEERERRELERMTPKERSEHLKMLKVLKQVARARAKEAKLRANDGAGKALQS